MSFQWSPMQHNEKKTNNMVPEPINQGFVQFQKNFPCMWQQQQQGQLMFPNLVPFLNNVNQPNVNNILYTGNNRSSSGQYQWQCVYSSERRRENNQINNEKNPSQAEYASNPPGAIYHHASGPGWQQQQIFYPPNSFK